MTEADLLLVKWWDYRLIPPKEATYAFIMAYCDSYFMFKEAQGANPYEGHPLVSLDIYHPQSWKHWKVMNSLRQWSDLYSFVYNEFWEEAFTIMRKWGYSEGYPHFFTSAKLLTEVKASLEGKSRIKMSKLPFFRAEGWRGTPLQVQYAEYLAQSVAEKYGGPDQAIKAVEVGALDSGFFHDWLAKQKVKVTV